MPGVVPPSSTRPSQLCCGDLHRRESKTERHEGKGTRVLPIFPELYPYLQDAFDQAEPGETHLITRYRNTNANLRTQLLRIIKKAGLNPWPKLFVNLRSSRETELVERFPMHLSLIHI